MPIARPCVPVGADELPPLEHSFPPHSLHSGRVSLVVLGGNASGRDQGAADGRLAVRARYSGARSGGVRDRPGGGQGPGVLSAAARWAGREAARGGGGC
jgi:hypothetical protein